MPPHVCLTGSQAQLEGSENALAGVLLSHNQHLNPLDLKSSCLGNPYEYGPRKYSLVSFPIAHTNIPLTFEINRNFEANMPETLVYKENIETVTLGSIPPTYHFTTQ